MRLNVEIIRIRKVTINSKCLAFDSQYAANTQVTKMIFGVVVEQSKFKIENGCL